MSKDIEITGGADPLVTAAILAAVTRLEEERAARAAVPPKRSSQGRWVLSSRPREPVLSVVRPPPVVEGWSVGSDDSDSVDGQ